MEKHLNLFCLFFFFFPTVLLFLTPEAQDAGDHVFDFCFRATDAG